METQSTHAIHAINRSHKPDQATADFIFRAYLPLKSAPPTIGKWLDRAPLKVLRTARYRGALSASVKTRSARLPRKGNAPTFGAATGSLEISAMRPCSAQRPPLLDQDALIKFFF